jgi:hypothetical protein
MGDRAVAGFRTNSSEPTIFIYQHWSGYDQSEKLAKALEASRPRWGDDSYATRIALSQMVGEEWSQELGYGIYVGGTSHGADYSYILVVEWATKKVLVCENDNSDTIVEEIDFEDFISNHEVLVPNATMTLDAEKHAEFLARHPHLKDVFSS